MAQMAESASPVVQQACLCESKRQTDARDGVESVLQRRPNGFTPAVAPPIVHDIPTSSGRPLADPVRCDMEPQLQPDLSRIRIDTGERSAQSARAVSAGASTVGQQIAFGAGQYQSAPPVVGGAGPPAPAVPSATGLGTGSVSASVSGITFTATGTFSPCSACNDGLEVIQVFWGTQRTDGVQVGTYQTVFPPLAATFDSFVDGGRHSPGGAVYSGNHPYYIGRPDLPKSYGYNPGMGGAGSVSGCTARPADTPGAVALHKEAYFETAFVCLDHGGSGKDTVMNAIQWGFTDFGTVKKAHPRTFASGPTNNSSPSSEFEKTLKADYPSYSHT
jgi:Domain of unknown function (DUF4157)